MKIVESCTCGATIDVESGLYEEVQKVQSKFHQAHKICKVKLEDKEGSDA